MPTVTFVKRNLTRVTLLKFTRSKLFLVACMFVLKSVTAVNALVPTDGTITVSSNDTTDAYVGTGGLLLPDSYSGSRASKQRVAACLDCIWRYTVYCSSQDNSFCAHAVTTCPSGQIRFRVWFGRQIKSLSVIGSVCWGADKPVTRHELEKKIDDQSIRYLPRLLPGVAPSNSTFTTVPVIVWTGQYSSFSPTPMNLLGRQVQIRATATWLWNWGDGTHQWTAQPGRKYPQKSLTHHYRRPGVYRIQVLAYWQANYQISGIGSFSVKGAGVHQQAQLPMTVKAGHTVLVAN